MAIQFEQVPNWVFWEIHGANIITFDLDRNGNSEVLILRVDHPMGGPNSGLYRVEAGLDAQGNETIQKCGQVQMLG